MQVGTSCRESKKKTEAGRRGVQPWTRYSRGPSVQPRQRLAEPFSNFSPVFLSCHHHYHQCFHPTHSWCLMGRSGSAPWCCQLYQLHCMKIAPAHVQQHLLWADLKATATIALLLLFLLRNLRSWHVWATMLQMFYPLVSCFMLGIEPQSLEEVSEQSPNPAHPTGPLQQHLKPQTETTELLHRSCPSSLWLSNCKIPPIAGDNSTPSLWHTHFCTHLNFAPFLLCTGLLHTCLFFRHHS